MILPLLLRGKRSSRAWTEVPETALVENPYQHTDFRSDQPRGAH